MPEKCILEAFGTGVPNGIVTVKSDQDIGLCRLFTIGAAACDSNEDRPEYSAELSKSSFVQLLPT